MTGAAARRRPEPQAVVLADALRRRFGPAALRMAERRGRTAQRRGQIGRADLYQAVCTILGPGRAVFERLSLAAR